MPEVKTPLEVYEGVPRDPEKQVDNHEARLLVESIQNMVVSGIGGYVNDYDDLPDASTVTEGVWYGVLNDAVVGNRGFWQASASTWGNRVDLTSAFSSSNPVVLSASGANTITATANRSFQTTALHEAFVMAVAQTNTGAVTLSVDGGTAYSVLTNGGSELSAGALVANALVELRFDGSAYRLTSNVSDLSGDLATAQADLATTQADLTTAQTDLAKKAEQPVSIYSDDFTGPIILDANGRMLRPSEAVLRIYSGDYAGNQKVGADGRRLGLALADSAGQGWLVGTDYEAAQPLWMPRREFIIDMWIAYGQSYTLGQTTTSISTTALHPGSALMLSSAIPRNAGGSAQFNDLVAPAGFEPPIVSAVNQIVDRFETAFGESVRVVAAAVGQGGQNYYSSKRGSDEWDELRRVVREFKTLAQELGLRPVVRGICIHWGEADATDAEHWQAAMHLRQFRQDVEDLTREELGQTETVKAVVSVPNRSFHSSAVRSGAWMRAVRDVALTEPEIFAIAAANYGVLHNAIGTDNERHPTAEGYRQLGILYGETALRHAYGTGRRPVDVTRCYMTSTTTATAEIYLPDGGTLQRDESGTVVGYPTDDTDQAYIGPPPSGSEADGRDGGWWVKDKDGSAGVVSAVVNGNNIDLTFSRALTLGTVELMYAVRSQSGLTSGDNTNMPRGVFRSDVSFTPPSGTAVYDWLIPQHWEL